MEKIIDVLTLGDVCVDLILSSKDITPEFGQKEKLIDNYSLEMGGSCLIFASQAAKLGLKTAVVGKVGNDQFGRLVLNTLEESGVLTEYIETVKYEKTGISVELNKGNDRAILTYNGTIDAVSINDVSDELLKKIRHLHIGSYFLMKKFQPYYSSIIKRLKQYGATVSLDTNWDPDENWDSGLNDIMPYVDIIILNENEIKSIANNIDLKQAVKNICEIVPIVIVKKGEDGASAYVNGIEFRSDAITGEVEDTIGAGDSFDGGFIYGFLTGKTIEKSLKIACICGSLNVRKSGGTKGQPRIEDLSNYINL